MAAALATRVPVQLFPSDFQIYAVTAQLPEGSTLEQSRRVAVFTGLPTVAGMGVFVGSYLLITKGIADIAPGITLAGSGFFFLLGLVGLSFGVLSSSWDPQPGSLLGLENLK